MAHSSVHTGSRSASGSAPCDGSIILRSDPYRDLEPFIRHLWTERRSMCCNIYPDQFPRGAGGKGATKDEEEEFILRYFSASDLHVQGGRFLKQVLYSIAKYNEDNVLKFAGKWAQEHAAFYEDLCSNAADIRRVLDEEESTNFPESFLVRVALVIEFGLRELRIAQSNNNKARSAVPEYRSMLHGSKRSTERAEVPCHELVPSDDAHQTSFVPTHLASEQLALHALSQQQQQKRKMVDSSRAEAMQHGTPFLHGQPRSTRFTPRQHYKQDHHGRHRRSSGSMHSPRMLMGSPMQHPAAMKVPTPFPEFDPNFPGFLDGQPGYMPLGYPMPSDARFMAPNVHGNMDYYPPPPYGTTSKPRSTGRNGSLPHHPLHEVGYYPTDADVRFTHHQRSGLFNQRGPRPSFSNGGLSNGTKVVDPNSFARFSDDRFSAPRSGRRNSFFTLAKPRRLSNRSGDGRHNRPFDSHRDNKPFNGSQRRVYSDHRAEYAAPASDRNRGSQSDSDKRSCQPVNGLEQPYLNQAPISHDDPEWSCSGDRIGNRRVDVDCLVATNLPNNMSHHEISGFLIKEVECIRAVPRLSNGGLIVFVSFRNMYEARRVLARDDLLFKGFKVVFRVPFRYWMDHVHGYIPPAHAKYIIESGQSLEGRSRHSSSGDSYQWQANVEQEQPIVTFTGSRPVLPSLSEASTPQKKTPKRSPRKRTPVVSAKSSSEVLQTQSEASHASSAGNDQTSAIKSDDEDRSASMEADLSCASDAAISPTVTPVADDSLTVATLSEVGAKLQQDSCPNEEDSTVGGSTPASDESLKHRDVSPKPADDVDDSFQTAAETPEPVIRIATPVETADHCAKGIHVSTPSPSNPESKAPSTAHSPASVSIADTEDTASISTSQPLPSDAQTAKRAAVPKPGPKQTESLSPFARQSQSKKKDAKSKPTKSKNKTLAEGQNMKKAETVPQPIANLTEEQAKRSDEDNPNEASKAAELEHLEPGVMQDGHRATSHSTPEKVKIEKENDASAVGQPTGQLSKDAAKADETKPDIEPASGQVFSKIRSATARLTGALSNMSTNKPKTEVGLPKVVQTDESAQESVAGLSKDQGLSAVELKPAAAQHDTSNELQSQNSHADMAGHMEPMSTAQPTDESSALISKPKKKKKRTNKKKKKAKAKNAAVVHDDDASSTETLAHETPAQSPPDPNASDQPRSSQLSSLGLKEGSVITLAADGVSFQASRTIGSPSYGFTGEDLARETNEEVERSRRKMQEMEERERMLKQKKT